MSILKLPDSGDLPREFNGRSLNLRPKKRKRTFHIHLALIFICGLLCAPVVYAFLGATQNNAQVVNAQLYPGSSLMDNFDTVWNQRELWRYIINSAIMSTVIAIGKAITGLLAGLAFVYFRFPGRGIVFVLVLITLMMPTEVSILALFGIVDLLGLSNNLGGLTIPFLASATAAFLFRQHFANLPANLSEAAQLDGASPMQFLFRVLIPLSWNVIGAMLVISFLFGWNMYLWPLLSVTDRNEQVVQVGLATLQQAGEGQAYGPLLLGALLASIPPVIVFLLLQKPFMSGFAMNRDK
ncbi:carbohydrate ABC transporter permease [Natronoglycomyces albus]|uniref:Carbohydrate ABC transporter permease n=1 Tax=Natronoglycomyces albus TaxID=2811108 RepID=A0A895XJN4_9ACTN|nr:carbohydrate ABC transporter permease [Natronoglycomyces albus]QSB05971.1 carbohydrate ABC transporter permease [Natronoglycomyces albus]